MEKGLGGGGAKAGPAGTGTRHLDSHYVHVDVCVCVCVCVCVEYDSLVRCVMCQRVSITTSAPNATIDEIPVVTRYQTERTDYRHLLPSIRTFISTLVPFFFFLIFFCPILFSNSYSLSPVSTSLVKRISKACK